MDSLQKWSGLCFSVKQVSRFLVNCREQYQKHTKYKELEIALCFVSSLAGNQRKQYLICFPTLRDLQSDERVTLAKILEQEIGLDEDFDIVIVPKEEAQQKNHRLQIVRFTGNVEGSTEALFGFLKKKKFNIPKDEKLLLLVWLEKGFQLDFLELSQKLGKANVPYVQFFILGKRKPDYSYRFFSCEVFPDIKRLRDVDFGFLKNTKEGKAQPRDIR
jgi:hypothetical protein